MRKKLTIIVLGSLILSNICFGQISGNRYVWNSEYIEFINDSLVDFNLLSNGCLVTQIRGFGKYYQIDNDILIETFHTDKIQKYSVSQLNDTLLKDSIYLKFISEYNGLPLEEDRVNIIDTKDSVIQKITITKSGYVSFKKNSNIRTLMLENYYGWQPVKIPIDKFKSNHNIVTINTFKVIENSTLKYRIEFLENKIKLTGPLPIDETAYRKEQRKYRYKQFIRSWPWRWRFRESKLHAPRERIMNKI